jgi:hypothetical protein
MTATAHDSVDFDHFHRKELPRRLATGNGPLAERAVERAGPLCFRLPDGAAWTYAAGPEGIDVVPGDAGAETLVELDLEAWRGLVTDIESAPGLLYAGRVRCVRGDPLRFVRWEPIWRAMFHGRPLYDPERHPLHDRDGSPLDPSRTFQIDDDRDELAHFLRETGYLLVRDVFRRDEVAGLLGVAHQVRAEAVPGDKRSWWGKNTRGEEVLCRVTHAGEVPELRALYEDARIRRIARLADAPLTPRAMGSVQGVTVLFKNPDMAEGLSDLPFHRDCGMGGHAIMCPTLCPAPGSAPTPTSTLATPRPPAASASTPTPETSPSTTATSCTRPPRPRVRDPSASASCSPSCLRAPAPTPAARATTTCSSRETTARSSTSPT